MVKQQNLCFNCLTHHRVSQCNSRHHCRKCKCKHHTSLCTDSNSKIEKTNSTVLTTISFIPTAHHTARDTVCYLKTAVATIFTTDTHIEANIFFDKGSQWLFITQSLADCLHIQSDNIEEIFLSSFGSQTTLIQKLEVILINLKAISGSKLCLSTLIVPTITTPLQNIGSHKHQCPSTPKRPSTSPSHHQRREL